MSDDGWEDSPATASKARKSEKAAAAETKRAALASKYGIPYGTGTGVPLGEFGPRVHRPKIFHRPRLPTERFDEHSPKGMKHSEAVTSTNAKACTYAHAFLRSQRHPTWWKRARSLDSVLYLCMNDFHDRLKDLHDKTNTYNAISNKLAWSTSREVFELYLKALRELANEGFNVREHLDNAIQYDATYETTLQRFFNEREIESIHTTGYFVSPQRMPAFTDDDDGTDGAAGAGFLVPVPIPMMPFEAVGTPPGKAFKQADAGSGSVKASRTRRSSRRKGK